MLKEFRDFLMRGNVVDLAVAVVIGGAFALVVASLTADILTPLLGLIGVPDFSTLSLQVGSASIMYGNFLNVLIAFILVAAAIFFFVVKPMNAMKAREAAAPVTTKTCTECASAIPLAAKRCPNCTQPQS